MTNEPKKRGGLALHEVHEIRIKHGRERKHLTPQEKIDLINVKGIAIAKQYGLPVATATTLMCR